MVCAHFMQATHELCPEEVRILRCFVVKEIIQRYNDTCWSKMWIYKFDPLLILLLINRKKCILFLINRDTL